MKITNKTINEKVQQLQLNDHDIGVNFAGQPARPRITNKAGDRDLSGRMPATDIHIWLDGYVTGNTENRTASR
jgi:hypothetical protein